ncbi:hypothetical protein [Shewanella atlantica]|uniref:hypothetical protein n=1 Tax=Shewanella atlantica TaxID=271099 RepID=UPI001639B116|nr:hypothetical protein [Shewanella atlantica]
MKYKQIPNSTCEFPDYYPTLPTMAKIDPNKLARSAEILRRLKRKFFGGAK